MKNVFITNLLDNIGEHRLISQTLEDKIKNALENNQKTILYLNRRGEFSSVSCLSCQKILKCKNCDLSLKLHNQNNLVCHFCGHNEVFNGQCTYCNSENIKKVGAGTQQIENEISRKFPNAKIFRFDRDSIKNQNEKENAIESLKNADIIVGTKMITTGFDFDDVGVIGVILAESELNIPSFDTEEKVFQNIKQLFGRSGRKGTDANIVIQTYIPENNSLKIICEKNYREFFAETLKERKTFGYPPFNEIADISVKTTDKEKGKKVLKNLFETLQNLDEKKEYKIFLSPQFIQRNKYFIAKITIKGQNIRNLLDKIKDIIYGDGNINVNFR